MADIRKDAGEAGLSALIALLHDAEEDDERVRDALSRAGNDTYTAYEAERLVGAAVLDRGSRPDLEILYIGVDQQLRGRGYGRALIEHLKAVAVRSGRRLIVGTGNSSLDNIAFYQRCGFRMDAVKKDYFDYVEPPVEEFGIPLRDLIVFAYEGP